MKLFKSILLINLISISLILAIKENSLKEKLEVKENLKNNKRNKLLMLNRNKATEQAAKKEIEGVYKLSSKELEELNDFPSTKKKNSKAAKLRKNDDDDEAKENEEVGAEVSDYFKSTLQASQSSFSSSSSSSSSSESSESSSSSSTKMTQTSSYSMNSVKLEQQDKWKAIFKTLERRQICSSTEKARIDKKKSDNGEDSFVNIGYHENSNGGDKKSAIYLGLPFPKPTWNDKKFGFGEAGYYFDYLDSCFQAAVTKIFNEIYNSAKKIKDDPEKDPYSLMNQLKIHNNLGKSDKIDQSIFIQKTDPKIQLFSLSAAEPSFNPHIFNLGVNYVQLQVILNEWGWLNAQLADYADPAKHILDKFDWDGNGRLDPREFIFFSIRQNIDILGVPNPKIQHFYNQFISSFLEPIFQYADCDGDGLLNSENLWLASENLVCRHPLKYNIYKCDAKSSDGNSDYRTASTNDFILKNKRSVDAYLTKQEFYRGILLGYWDRQTTNTGILNKDQINMKNERWHNDGILDIECQDIKDTQRILKS